MGQGVQVLQPLYLRVNNPVDVLVWAQISVNGDSNVTSNAWKKAAGLL